MTPLTQCRTCGGSKQANANFTCWRCKNRAASKARRAREAAVGRHVGDYVARVLTTGGER